MTDIAKLIWKQNVMATGSGPWEESNVKAFPLSGTWSSAAVIAEAQAIFDYYSEGNTPIVVYDSKRYFIWRDMFNQLAFVSPTEAYVYDAGNAQLWNYWSIWQYRLTFNYSWSTVTSVSAGSDLNNFRFLDTMRNYSIPYVPQYPWSPATKKYVDDIVWDVETLLSNI